jgi:asparagine synthase (glutamine-hydrolysing)
MPFIRAMELFLLVKNRGNIRSELTGNVREEFLDSDFLTRDEGNYRFYLNRKTLALSSSSYTSSYGSVFGTGTFIYRAEGPEESLKLLLDDFTGGRFDHASLLGHYFIFLFLPSGIKVLTDGTGLVKAYHDNEGSYLSSSFLLAARLHNRLTLNRAAATENLLTGGIAGTETLVNEINSFSKASVRLFKDVEFVFPGENTQEYNLASRTVALQGQSERLLTYFRSCRKIAEGGGADIGLTGGYDSRLMLACARNHIPDLQIHSHYRPAGSEEWRIARRIAEGEKIRFISPEVTPPQEMDDEKLYSVISSSFRFNDGVISLHCNWMEEYNTLEYRSSVLGDKRLGFSGIGGEQYRNQDRLYGKPWLFSQWIKYSHMRRVSGSVFQSRKDEHEMLERLRTKFYCILGFSKNKRFIDIYDLKRIQNEVIIPAYRGARTDAENRHAWYLSPLADFQVSTAAYGITGFLKDSKSFEADLIRMISPSLAAYPTDYGYDLVRGEPAYARILSSAFENLLPGSLKWEVRERFKSGGKTRPVLKMTGSSELLQEYTRNVTSVGLPVSIPELVRREATAHMVISLGYFLEKLEISTD